MRRNCDHCKKEYVADTRNISRGWGLCCSKSCAARKREKSKPGYNPTIVQANNDIRAGRGMRLRVMSDVTDDDDFYDQFL